MVYKDPRLLGLMEVCGDGGTMGLMAGGLWR